MLSRNNTVPFCIANKRIKISYKVDLWYSKWDNMTLLEQFSGYLMCCLYFVENELHPYLINNAPKNKNNFHHSYHNFNGV